MSVKGVLGYQRGKLYYKFLGGVGNEKAKKQRIGIVTKNEKMC